MKIYDNCDYCQYKIGETIPQTKCQKGHNIHLVETGKLGYYDYVPSFKPGCKDKFISVENTFRIEYASLKGLTNLEIQNNNILLDEMEIFVADKMADIESNKPKPVYSIIINGVVVKTACSELSYDELHNIIDRNEKGVVSFNRKSGSGFTGKVKMDNSIKIENGLIFNII